MIEILIGIGVLYTSYKLTQVLDFNEKIINKGKTNAK
jgi:hypothetical protein